MKVIRYQDAEYAKFVADLDLGRLHWMGHKTKECLLASLGKLQ